jgi:hypothetical protein
MEEEQVWTTFCLTSLWTISMLNWQGQAAPPHNQSMNFLVYFQKILFSKVCSPKGTTLEPRLVNSTAL